METQSEIIPLFPIPLFINYIPQFIIEECLPFLEKESIDYQGNSKEWGARSSDTYLFQKGEYKNLKRYILEKVLNYAEKIFNYNYKNYIFSQSWISIKNPNESHGIHSHSNSLISGIIFYENYNNSTSPIVFSRKDNWTENHDNHPHQTNLPPNEYSATECYLPVKPNSLLLFPSSLNHYVPKNTTNVPRKSLAFNIVPKDGFGKEEFLNKLKFNN